MSDAPDPHHVVMTFGKHKGELLTRLPLGYIKWMANQTELPQKWRALAKENGK